MLITTMRVSAAGETHPGGRPSNQDTFLVESHLGLYAVFDGMGGHAAGEVAAQLARDSLVEFTREHSNGYSPRELVELGIASAGASVFRSAKDRPEYRGMGTTVVVCLVSEQNELVVGHVGDSRAYLLRDGQLHLLTHDHNIAQEYLDAGQKPDEAELRCLGNLLTRNLGQEQSAKPDMLEMPLRAGDRLLLCTDGLSNCVSPEALQYVLGSDGPPQELARTMVEMALASGTAMALASGTATDNITALVLAFSDAGGAGGKLEHADTRSAA